MTSPDDGRQSNIACMKIVRLRLLPIDINRFETRMRHEHSALPSLFGRPASQGRGRKCTVLLQGGMWGDPPCFCIVGRDAVMVFLDQVRDGTIPHSQYWVAYIYVDDVDAVH